MCKGDWSKWRRNWNRRLVLPTGGGFRQDSGALQSHLSYPACITLTHARQPNLSSDTVIIIIIIIIIIIVSRIALPLPILFVEFYQQKTFKWTVVKSDNATEVCWERSQVRKNNYWLLYNLPVVNLGDKVFEKKNKYQILVFSIVMPI